MSSSKWSSYLQQTLAGVESRLDTILVGDEPPRHSPPVAKPAPENSPASRNENGPSRSSSTSNSTGDRLQERLAKAIAAKNYAAQKTDNQASSNGPSRVPTPVQMTDTPRLSSELGSVHTEVQTAVQDDAQSTDASKIIDDFPSDTTNTGADEQNGNRLVQALEGSPRPSIESASAVLTRRSLDSPRQSTDGEAESLKHEIVNSTKSDIEREELKKQRTEMENVELQRQEEIHGYIERIDALQAKLQYLSRESAESARKAVAAASPNSVDKKLAEREQQIALLLEEGQKLSKTELKHMTVIKNLRSKASETDKEVSEAKKKADRLEKEKMNLAGRLKRAEVAERQLNLRQKALTQAQRDVETLTTERNAKNTIIAELKAQVAESTSQANANEVKAVYDLLEREKRRVAELENDLSSVKIEKELAAGRAKLQMDELRSKHERETERARIAEVEMRAEQQLLESRLEVIRTRAEEVSSGATGDAQAKLLRQIETLQTQYAVATENWQGIEASLTSRAASLGKERDEALKRETEVRRKAREITVKSKRNEDELEDRRTKMDILQQELEEYKANLEKLQARAEESEAMLIDTKRTFDQERQAWKLDVQQRIDEERTKWREDSLGQSPFGHSRADSPVMTSHRGLTAEFLGLQNLQNRRASSRSITNETPVTERRVSRKSSVQPLRSSGRATPQRQDSTQSLANEGDVMETPSIHAIDHEDYFENILSPSSPHNITHDVLSISTVGAGPSVQLVERMSAAVRRLESEKVSTKEELARLSTQRDDARAQIHALMQEAEANKNLSSRIKDLEMENEKIDARYQTTLEMLGEKSEREEELKADIQDLKDMYRELVERTVK